MTQIEFLKACDEGDILIIEEYIRNGNPSAQDAIKWASANGHTEVVKLLLQDDRVDPSNQDNYAIKWASMYGHTEVVKLLLQDVRVDPSYNNNTSIRWASHNGHTEVIKLLLADKRVDPSDEDDSAIIWASENGRTEVVKLLLSDKRVDPSNKDNYAIRMASINGHIDIVKLLINDYGFKFTNNLNDYPDIIYQIRQKKIKELMTHTEFIEACKKGDILIVEEYIRHGDPSYMNNYAIRMASENGHTEVVKLLLADKRVDPSDIDNNLRWASANNYNSAIILASENGHTEIVKLLINDYRFKFTDNLYKYPDIIYQIRQEKIMKLI